VGGQKPPRPSGGRTSAVVQGVERGGQLQREAVVGGEAVGGELGLPADHGVGQGTEGRGGRFLGIASTSTGPLAPFVGWYLIALVILLVGGRYVPAWLAIVDGRPAADYLAGPGMWWTVDFEDLALLLPALAVTAIGLLRNARWTSPAVFTSAGCLGLVGAAVAGMAWSTTLHSDPGSTTGTALTMTAIGLISAGPVLICWLAVARGRARVRGTGEPPAPVPDEPLVRYA
jgi:hypothetical protein